MIIHSLAEDPAKSDGRLQPGDELVEVDGRSLVGLPLPEGKAIIKGTSGTATFRVRKRGGVTTPPATSPTSSTAAGIGGVVAMDASHERGAGQRAEVDRSLVKEEKQPALGMDRIQQEQQPQSAAIDGSLVNRQLVAMDRPIGREAEAADEDGGDVNLPRVVPSLGSSFTPREIAPSDIEATPTMVDPALNGLNTNRRKSSYREGVYM